MVTVAVRRKPTVTSVRKGERFRSLVRLSTKAVKDKPYRNVRSSIHLRKAGVCLWTLSKTKSNTGLGRHRRMRRETPKTNKTVMRVVELEAPTSALVSWGTSRSRLFNLAVSLEQISVGRASCLSHDCLSKLSPFQRYPCSARKAGVMSSCRFVPPTR